MDLARFGQHGRTTNSFYSAFNEKKIKMYNLSLTLKRTGGWFKIAMRCLRDNEWREEIRRHDLLGFFVWSGGNVHYEIDA